MAALLLLTAWCSSASAAEFGVVPGSFTAALLDAEGHAENLAGSHPDRLDIAFALNVEGTGTSARDLAFDLPPGFAGDPAAVPPCPRITVGAEEECPPESQVGLFRLGFANGQHAELPIFLVEAAPGQLPTFASKPGFDLPLTMQLRGSDYGITFEASGLPQTESPLSEGRIDLWGIPADHEAGAPIPRRAFLSAPSRCGTLEFALRVRSWQEGAPWLSAHTDSGAPLAGCESLRFEPGLQLRLGDPHADSPTGFDLELTMAESDDPGERASARLQGGTIELPAGVTFSPAGAAGLAACGDAQFSAGTSDPPTCPASSRVGTVAIESPLLSAPLLGAIYLGTEHEGERFRLLVYAPGPGVAIKFASALEVDPRTGRLSAKLAGLPQFPLQHLRMSVDGGPTALLASPLACGPGSALGHFEPSGGGAAVDAATTVEVVAHDGTGCGGELPFAPVFEARGSTQGAGRPTVFSTSLQREDGEELPRRLTLEMPSGLSASLGTVSPCGDAEAAKASCPASSQIGSALAEIGPGPIPAALPGAVYLTGPYRRAPFGLAVELPAKIGPFDLGTLTLRATASVDSRSGRIAFSTDVLPVTVEGVSIRLRALDFTLDRPGLIRNPTRCGSSSLDGQVEAQSGRLATISSGLLVRHCGRLGFRPRFRMALRQGAGGRGGAGLRVSARMRSGDANLEAMRIALPRTMKLDIAGIGELCSRRDASHGLCPKGSRVGSASARTTLLSRPLEGSVYIVQPSGDGLPDMWVSLAGQGVRVEMRGTTSMRSGRLVTALSGLPDMTLSSFAMRLGAGGSGVLSIACPASRSTDLAATVDATAQNGARRDLRVPVAAADCAHGHA